MIHTRREAERRADRLRQVPIEPPVLDADGNVLIVGVYPTVKVGSHTTNGVRRFVLHVTNCRRPYTVS